jgi:hypothetical protein
MGSTSGSLAKGHSISAMLDQLLHSRRPRAMRFCHLTPKVMMRRSSSKEATEARPEPDLLILIKDAR